MLAPAGRVGHAPQPPGQPTLIYDPRCGFCLGWVKRVQRWDTRGTVRVIGLEEPEAARLSGQPVRNLRQAVHFVGQDGAVFAGAAAARELLGLLRGGQAVRMLAAIPGVMPAAERLYRWVARRWGPVPRDGGHDRN
ncbi:MAG: DCC1-like thiol-disulfide oxidoreductase family protein [Gemmatimonadales bacterium]|jgi:predicted DCC family thiol-disulfide oxidoreductase YuxK